MVERTNRGLDDDGGGGDGDSMIGRLIGGKYKIIALLGAGGFGAVYKAEQAPVGRIVAVKVIRANARDDEELRGRFLREARSVARLKSPHIVTLYDYGDEPDGLLYMVFEYVDGTPLDEVIKAQGPLEVQTALTLVIQILEALSEAHEYGIVHRDLKPPNIMVSKGAWGVDVARVLDFGIAKVVSAGPDDEQTVETRQGLILGTPHYMAPEQAHAVTVDGRTDLYAIGILLYAMLKGHPPFLGSSAYAILEAHVLRPASVPLAELDAPPGLKKVIGRALEKNPEDRYQSAREMAEALNALVKSGGSQLLSAPSGQLRVSELLPKPQIPDLSVDDTSEVVLDDGPAEPKPSSGKKKTLVAFVLVVLIGVAIAVVLSLQPGPEPETPTQMDATKFQLGQSIDQGVSKDAMAQVVDSAPVKPDAKPVKDAATRSIKSECRVSRDCPGRSVCRSGKCVRQRRAQPRCRRDGDCPSDHFCEKGKCKKIQVPEF